MWTNVELQCMKRPLSRQLIGSECRVCNVDLRSTFRQPAMLNTVLTSAHHYTLRYSEKIIAQTVESRRVIDTQLNRAEVAYPMMLFGWVKANEFPQAF